MFSTWVIIAFQNVRKELVATTYFEYFQPGRMLVRQNHESTFMGFVLRGVLVITVDKIDPVFGGVITEVTGHLHPGAVFGDVSLLHNIPRTATVTTTCELGFKCEILQIKPNLEGWRFWPTF